MRYTLLFLFLLFFALTFFPFSASAVECDSCADCSAKIANDTYIELNTSISDNTTTCVESFTTLKENITIDCKGHSITSTSATGGGIRLRYITNITIINCTIEGFYYGLYLQDIFGSNNSISNVAVNNYDTYGVVLDNTCNVSVANSTIVNCRGSSGAGIYIYYSTGADITRNEIYSSAYGIYVSHNSDYNTITENIISDNNKAGIFLEEYSVTIAPDNNTITANRIRNNSRTETPKYEIKVGADCANNNITENALKHAICDSGNDTVVSGNIYSDFIVGPASLFITDFSTIAGAITGASPYSLVHVMSGTYSECVTVNKSLHLRGESRANTSINCCVFGRAATEIKSDDVNLSEFTMNATSGIALQAEDVSNITIEKNLLVGGLGSLEFSNVTNSTAKSNNITDAVLVGKDTQHINISYNFFSGLFLLKSINNNLWMNNFTDSDNEYYQNENDYCVFGLDNRYHESIIDDPPLSCIAEFYNRFNDTAVYANETILFSANTSFGESNYTAINVTINSTNYTLELTAGDNVDGLWTYAFDETVEVGQYVATMLYYIEADDDEGAMGIYYVNFTVSKLNMTTVLNTTIANVTDTIFMEANTTGNATPIENVLAEIYWNGSIKDSTNMTLQSCSGALKDRCRYMVRLNTSLTLSQVLGRLNTSFTIVVIQRRKSIVHPMMRHGKTK